VSDQVTQAIDQAQQTAARQRQEVLQVQQTPFLAELPADEQQRVSQQGETALAELGAAQVVIETLRQQADDGAVGRADDEAAFEASVADNGARIRRLGHWLNEVALTPQEQAAYERLGHGEAAEDDLAGWRAATGLDDDTFWRVARGLFEKRRIRIQVGRVGP
jgi:cell pole-organizing protein PopZ